MNRLLTFAAALAGLLCTSCEKELDFDYSEIEPLTVIEASLTASEASVRIARTSNMDEPLDRTPTVDATVVLADLTTGVERTLAADAGGIFTLAEGGIEGQDYRLSVSCPTGRYTATATMMPKVEIEDASFSWIKMPYDRVALFELIFRDVTDTPGDCYRVRLYRNGVPYRRSIVRDNSADGGLISVTFMTTRLDIDAEGDDDLLIDGDIVTAAVDCIPRALYDYFEAISSGSNGDCMFEGGYCLGYFLASPVTTVSLAFCRP
ncbi:MAG: DUF4249 family protein [Muribaculaceae bacterium]|nr:DUF4249 family protein [Muribaculaceae bacterium]